MSANKLSIQQVMQNLISNALKYRNKDIETKIVVSAVETALFWQFQVSDNGIGIDESFFRKIFIVFQRLHTKDEYDGNGIGLAICKKIIENDGGNIWLESTKEKGSSFYFTIKK